MTTPCILPEVTDAHRLAAFTAMCWPGWTYEAAMQHDLRRKIIECRALINRNIEWIRTPQHRNKGKL